jgi:hypothetical protein
MRKASIRMASGNLLAALLVHLWLSALAPFSSAGAGVTLITHGLNGDVDGWVTGMANQLTNYARFPGTNSTCYKLSVSNIASTYILTATRVAGSAPLTSDCSEIIVKLDWSSLADGNSYDTYQVASAVVPALLATNFISELGGHALVELPLHLIGHSRGGSLICEISRLLGTNGVWVDHLTTLDPHPLNDPAFPADSLLYTNVDAPARTYVNVLYHDNYWQNDDTFVFGQSVAGAYIRKQTNFSGGYSGFGGSHSDVHLWYHGTLDWRVPASDTEASLGSAQRQSWWVAYEQGGTNAGFRYSLIGGGDRLSTDKPLGTGSHAIFEGFNQWWDLGAGSSSNRTTIASNNGNWPDLIRFNRITTNNVVLGQGTPLRFYFQWAHPSSDFATVSIFLDDNFNPFDTNQTLLQQISVPASGASFVSLMTTNILLAASNATPGLHAFFAKIIGGGRTRYLYAPELVRVVSSQPPLLDIEKASATQFLIGVNGSLGQTIVLQNSTNLQSQSWLSFATNTLVTNRWVYTNNAPISGPQFYRAVLDQ